jgi:TatD DNase family protein
MAHNSYPLVDYHCHLDLYPSCEDIFRECAERSISVLAVTTTPKAWPKNKELAQNSPSIRVALGLHPQLVAKRASELQLFEHYLPDAPFIGEVGLDAGPQFYGSFDLQLQVFERILSLCAAAGRRVLSVHSVRAMSQTLRLIEKYIAGRRLAVVLHWFSGSKAHAKRAAELGCYFSINERMLSSPAGREIASSFPAERILTETDGPFVTIGGRPAHPSDVEIAVGHLAAIKNISVGAARSLIAANASTLDDYCASNTR